MINDAGRLCLLTMLFVLLARTAWSEMPLSQRDKCIIGQHVQTVMAGDPEITAALNRLSPPQRRAYVNTLTRVLGERMEVLRQTYEASLREGHTDVCPSNGGQNDRRSTPR
jgi:hypothetical protein